MPIRFKYFERNDDRAKNNFYNRNTRKERELKYFSLIFEYTGLYSSTNKVYAMLKFRKAQDYL